LPSTELGAVVLQAKSDSARHETSQWNMSRVRLPNEKRLALPSAQALMALK